MMGKMPKKDVPRVLSACTAACSLFIDHPYTAQNSPNKAFDAFAAGRPLAINHRGWIADLVAETQAGIRLSPGDPQAAARGLAEFLCDRERVATARRAAAKLAEERFSRDRLAQELIAALENAAGVSARAAAASGRSVR